MLLNSLALARDAQKPLLQALDAANHPEAGDLAGIGISDRLVAVNEATGDADDLAGPRRIQKPLQLLDNHLTRFGRCGNVSSMQAHDVLRHDPLTSQVTGARGPNQRPSPASVRSTGPMASPCRPRFQRGSRRPPSVHQLPCHVTRFARAEYISNFLRHSIHT